MSRILVDYLSWRLGTLGEARGGIFFEYDTEFLATGHELSPLNLPLGPGVRARDPVPTMRLPGLFEDSLPDQWGRRVMTEWFRRQGTPEHAITPLTMLACLGQRAMGALTYAPELEITPVPAEVTLRQLHETAKDIEESGPIDLDVMVQVGSSAGGARPKALIAMHRRHPGRLITGTSDLPPEFDGWLVKFDTSRNGAQGAMEEAYARMARAAGIDVPETRLLETRLSSGRRRNFAVKRFDRDGVRRIHHHTLAALCHAGPGDMDYSAFLRITRRMTKDEREVWRAFRRAAFNVLASNRDDHGKNHGFLYREKEWKLGPAYDLTFSSPEQLPERGMAVAGERRTAGPGHLLKVAEDEALDRRQASAVIDEVRDAIGRWREFADAAGVPAAAAAEVGSVLRMELGNARPY